MQVILKTTKEHKHSSTNVLPVVGEVTFSHDGKISVEVKTEEDLHLLLEALPDLFVFEEEKEGESEEAHEELEHQTVPNEIGKSQDESNDIGVAEESVELSASSLLEGKTVNQLKDLAKESGFPFEEWQSLLKAPLVEYLKAKLEA